VALARRARRISPPFRVDARTLTNPPATSAAPARSAGISGPGGPRTPKKARCRSRAAMSNG
jgi:hypothetical protein